MSTSLCKVCSKSAAKYKCPTCRLPFCSVPCSRAHKADPCSAVASSAAVAPPPTQSPALPLPAPTPPPPGLLSGADVHPLTREQRDALVACPDICAAVKDKDLQELVRSVDGAKDPVAALVAAMAGSDRFGSLADLMLGAVGDHGIGGGGRGEKEKAREELLRLLQS